MSKPTIQHGSRAPGPKKPAVLFLCVQNAGRSQMAAAWMRHLAGDAVDVYSGGSEPASEVNAAVVEAMAEVGIDVSTQVPKAWSDDVLRIASVVITMGCGDSCPVHAGKRYEDWAVADPKGRDVGIVRTIRDDIEGRVIKLLTELGVNAGA